MMRIFWALAFAAVLLAGLAYGAGCLLNKLPTSMIVSESYEPATGLIVAEARLTYTDPATGKKVGLGSQEIRFEVNYTTERGEFTEEEKAQTDNRGWATASIALPGSKKHTVYAYYKGNDAFEGCSATVGGGGVSEPIFESTLPEGINLVTCMPVLLLLGFLGAAMYASGRSPFGMVDFTAPRGFRVQSRVRKSFQAGWASVVSSAAGALKAVGKGLAKAEGKVTAKKAEEKKEPGPAGAEAGAKGSGTVGMAMQADKQRGRGKPPPGKPGAGKGALPSGSRGIAEEGKAEKAVDRLDVAYNVAYKNVLAASVLTYIGIALGALSGRVHEAQDIGFESVSETVKVKDKDGNVVLDENGEEKTKLVTRYVPPSLKRNLENEAKKIKSKLLGKMTGLKNGKLMIAVEGEDGEIKYKTPKEIREGLEEQRKGLEKRNEQLKKSVSEAKEKIEKLKGEKKELEKKSDKIKSEIRDLKRELKDAKGVRKSEIEEKIRILDGKKKDVDNQIVQKGGHISDLEKMVKDINGHFRFEDAAWVPGQIKKNNDTIKLINKSIDEVGGIEKRENDMQKIVSGIDREKYGISDVPITAKVIGDIIEKNKDIGEGELKALQSAKNSLENIGEKIAVSAQTGMLVTDIAANESLKTRLMGNEADFLNSTDSSTLAGIKAQEIKGKYDKMEKGLSGLSAVSMPVGDDGKEKKIDQMTIPEQMGVIDSFKKSTENAKKALKIAGDNAKDMSNNITELENRVNRGDLSAINDFNKLVDDIPELKQFKEIREDYNNIEGNFGIRPEELTSKNEFDANYRNVFINHGAPDAKEGSSILTGMYNEKLSHYDERNEEILRSANGPGGPVVPLGHIEKRCEAMGLYKGSTDIFAAAEINRTEYGSPSEKVVDAIEANKGFSETARKNLGLDENAGSEDIANRLREYSSPSAKANEQAKVRELMESKEGKSLINRLKEDVDPKFDFTPPPFYRPKSLNDIISTRANYIPEGLKTQKIEEYNQKFEEAKESFDTYIKEMKSEGIMDEDLAKKLESDSPERRYFLNKILRDDGKFTDKEFEEMNKDMEAMGNTNLIIGKKIGSIEGIERYK